MMLYKKKRKKGGTSLPSFQNDTIERQAAFNRRIFMLGGFVAFGMFALGGRLMHLQFLQGERYKNLSQANQYNFRIIPPPRGDILDRYGRLIAGNRPSFRVMIMPNEVKNIDETLDQLSYILPNIAASRRRILRDMNQNQRFVPTIVASDLNWEDFSRVSLYAAEIPGVVADMADIRVYQHGGAFSHVVGYVSRMSRKEQEKEKTKEPLLLHPAFRIGKNGIEKAFDKELRGQAGAHKVEVNARGQVIAEDKEGSSQPVKGKDVTLTIDLDVQNRAVEVFGQESGAAVMLNIQTGEVICMTSTPGFDPNLFVSGISGDHYGLLRDYERKPLLDKAYGSTFAPGSTFKMTTTLALLSVGVDPEERVFCGGGMQFGNRFFRCHAVHSTVNMREALKFSCDSYFYHMCNRAGVDRIAKVARALGLGQKFEQFELVDDQKKGLIPDTVYKREKFKNDPTWHPGETLSVSIGQGYTHVSPLQLAVYTARLANGQRAVEPYVIKAIGGVDQVKNHNFPPVGIPAEHLQIARDGMYMVSNEPNGTAFRPSQLQLGDIKLAGKTGTAQVRSYGTGPRKANEWLKKDHGLFVCFAPYDKPKYALSVVVEHGVGGARFAAPKAREIMRLALLKDPDIQKRLVVPVADRADPVAAAAGDGAQSDTDTTPRRED